MRNHFDFIVAAANMRAEMFGIEGTVDETVILNMLSSVNVPAFEPVDGVKIAANEAEAKEQKEGEATPQSGMMDPDAEAKQILGSLPSPGSLGGLKVSQNMPPRRAESRAQRWGGGGRPQPKFNSTQQNKKQKTNPLF